MNKLLDGCSGNESTAEINSLLRKGEEIMKKNIAVCLVLVLAFTMAACNRKDNGSMAENPGSEEPQNVSTSEIYKADTASIVEDFTDSNAVYMCQFVKDCLAEPDSFQIHGVSHIEENGHHFYYLDFSHEIKNKEMERTYYFAEFDGSTLLYIVNENSAIYYQAEGEYTTKHPVLSAMFQKQKSQQLDTGRIVSSLT